MSVDLPPTPPGRNDPCWCGSGKKFKRCHLGHETQAPASSHELSVPLQRAYRRRVCWHHGVDGVPCTSVISAHTVPKGMALRQIAEGGHVIGVRRHTARPGGLPHRIGNVGILRRHKGAFDAAFQRGDWFDMHGTVESPPPLMCSGLVAPHYDFAGGRLPGSTGWYLTDDMVSLDLLGAGELGVAVLAWRTPSRAPGEALARTLAHLPCASTSDALVRLAFEGTDNWFASPSWWTTLPEPTRRELIQRVPCGGPARPHPPHCLARHTASYAMPAVVAVDHVNWAG